MISEAAAKVVVIGLDCAEPSLVFDRFADRLPNLTRLREPRGLGQAAELRPADHGAGLDVDDVEQGPRHARLLRVPQPRRSLVREDDDGHLARRARALALGLPGRGRQAGDPDRRPADLSAPAGQRPDGDRLPHAVDRVELHLSRPS